MFRKYFKRLVNRQYEKKTGLNGYVYEFDVDYRPFNLSNIDETIPSVHNYFREKYDIK